MLSVQFGYDMCKSSQVVYQFCLANTVNCFLYFFEQNIAILEREDSDSSSSTDLSDTESSNEENQCGSDSNDPLVDHPLISSNTSQTQPAASRLLNPKNIRLPGVKPALKKISIEVLTESSELYKDQVGSSDFPEVDTVR